VTDVIFTVKAVPLVTLSGRVSVNVGVPVDPPAPLTLFTVTDATLADVAPPCRPPRIKLIAIPCAVHTCAATVNGLNPVAVVPVLLAGLKIPIEYRTAATITMTSMAQPYVIIYSKADCAFLFI
jgi:hypothetical protein